MNVTKIIDAAAATHSVETSEILSTLAGWGWDFSPFTGTPEEIIFLTKTIDGYAAKIAARHAKIEAIRAREITLREKNLTKAARANPAAQCGKCDGSGRVVAFSHIANGSCFQCQGTGVIRLRSGMTCKPRREG